jgi:hypothetical protein
MRLLARVLAALGVAALIARPAIAQEESWQDKWYWGAQAGMFAFETPNLTGFNTAFGVGGNWFITAKRAALEISVTQLFFSTGTTSSVPNPSSGTGLTTVDFTGARVYRVSVLAIPTDAPIQPYGGLGFAINPFASVAEQNAAVGAVDEQRTKAFLVFTGGLQMRLGRMAIFGQVDFLAAGNDFLISSDQASFTGGIRYALTTSHEAVTTEQ